MKLVILLLTIMAVAFGQAPDGEPKGFPPPLEEFLMLEPGQADAIVAENEAFRVAVEPLQEEVKRLSRELAEATRADNPDPGTLGLLLFDLEMKRRDIEAVREAMQETVVNDILTSDEQRQRLQALERARRLMPIYEMARRWRLVDTPRQHRRQGPGDEPGTGE